MTQHTCSRVNQSASQLSLTDPLIFLTEDDGDVLTLRDLFEGTQVFGGTGSGKTSGSGKTLAYALLRSGCGGLVLTTKPGDAKEWTKYAEDCRRSSDLALISPGCENSIDFMQYEHERSI